MHARTAALVVGIAAALAMGVIGCTNIIGGTAAVDTSAAPAYRSWVSESVSASAATSSLRESQRQQTLTTRAVRGACVTFAKTSSDAIETVNKYVSALNKGGDTGPTEGPAVDALNHSADEVSHVINDTLSPELHDAFNSYVAAARGVADAIAGHASTSQYNSRTDQLNTVRARGMQLCRAY